MPRRESVPARRRGRRSGVAMRGIWAATAVTPRDASAARRASRPAAMAATAAAVVVGSIFDYDPRAFGSRARVIGQPSETQSSARLHRAAEIGDSSTPGQRYWPFQGASRRTRGRDEGPGSRALRFAPSARVRGVHPSSLPSLCRGGRDARLLCAAYESSSGPSDSDGAKSARSVVDQGAHRRLQVARPARSAARVGGDLPVWWGAQ